MKYLQKPSKKFGDFAEKLYLCGTEQYNQRKRNTMDQNGFLRFCNDGKTVCVNDKDYKGAIVIPNGVTRLGYYAFLGCTGITSIEIPDSVTTIGECAFSGCTSLTSIEIPDSVTEIGKYAFSGCTSLSSIKIPSSVKENYDSFLKGCNNLVEIHLRHKKPIYFTSAFDGRDLSDYPSDFYPTPLGYLSKVFEGLDLSKIILFVPIGSENEYQQHPFYSKFAKIVSEK